MTSFISLVERVYAAGTESDIASAASVGDLVTKIYNWVLVIGVPLGVLMFIYAGYLYMTSQGNPDNIKTAKDIIISTLVGFALIVLSGVILQNVIGVKNP